MENNPQAILALIKGCKSQPTTEYFADNLEVVAKMLTNECTLNSKHTLIDIEERCFVGSATAKVYLNIFRNAYLFVTEQGDRDRLVAMARKGNRSYFGIACLLDQKVVDRSRYESVKTYAQEKSKREQVSAPPVTSATPKPVVVVKPPEKPTKTAYQYEEEIAKLKKELKTEHERIKDAFRRLSTAVKEQARLTSLNDFLKRNLTGLGEGKQLADQLSRFFTSLGTNLLAEKQVECLELAGKVKDLVERKLDLHLPPSTIWQGKKWAKIVFTPDAQVEFVKFARDFSELPRALKHALFNLSLNFRHPSLRTYKKEVNPPGIPADAFTSRASDKFRFYWTASVPATGASKDVEVLIHKIDVKRG